ncbi:MAG: hypothetical protein HDQ88_05760 [Clostridia bacterium]|nr:hypothetical protein [Clostridia bacterium]
MEKEAPIFESAICPSCRQIIEVNPPEEVDFCKLCGKPFITVKAIKLKAQLAEEEIKRVEEERDRAQSSIEPSQVVKDKFYAILAEDLDIAEHYLNDVVKKEYPKLSLPRLALDEKLSKLAEADLYFQENHSEACFGYSRPEILARLKNDLDKAEADYKTLLSINLHC